MLPAMTLCWRELVRFYRQRSRLLGALGTPLVFWILIGSGFGSSFQPPSASQEASYLEYFYPGTVLLIVLFTSIFSTFSTIEDRREGFLQSVLVAPVPRSAIVFGKVAGGATLAFLQGFVFILMAPLVGIPLDLAAVISVALALFLTAFWITGLGFAIAWQMESTQGFHSVMNLFFMPMWLLSGALFPPVGASTWVQWVMVFNPLTYSLALLRHSLYAYRPEAAGFPGGSLALAITLACVLAVSAVSFYVVRRPAVRSFA
jgi:ABC-2 type transport system permease protein